MFTLRLVFIAVICALYGKRAMAASKIDYSQKLKREINIIGPIPSRFRGQASGLTTFDGILANDLALPATDSQSPRASPQVSQPTQSVETSSTPRVGEFQAESAPNVYNYDGKESVTYDGVLATDLTPPYTHYSVIRPQSPPALPNYFSPRIPQISAQQPVYRPTSYSRPQPSAYSQLQSIQQADSVPTNAGSPPFNPKTPSERYNLLQQQYHAALTEYRNSLIRFQEQLNKYSALSLKQS